jgi:hypothetical protein
MLEPNVVSRYDEETDSLLVAMYYEDGEKIWEAPNRIRPTFG